MAGSGTKLWATGDTVSASEFQSYVQDQTIAVFDDATARDAAYGGAGEPTASEGMVCFLLDTNCVQVHTGSVWYNTIDIDSFSFEGDGDMSLTTNLIIGSSGALSIGAGTTPTVPLDITNTTGSGALIKYDGTANTEYGLTIRSNISGGNFESDFANGGTAMLDLDANSATTSGGDFLVCQTQSSDPVLLVKGNGKIGVGTSSPAYPLDVAGTSHTYIGILAGTDSSAGLRLRNDARDWDLNITTADKFAIYDHTAADTRLTIDTSGNVGIGTTAPVTQLHLAGVDGREALRISGAGGGGGVQGSVYLGFHHWSTGTHPSARIGCQETDVADYDASLLFQTRSSDADVVPTTRMTIDEAGNVGIGRTPSSSFALDVEKPNASTYARIRITDSYSSYSRAALYIEGGSNEGAIIYLGDAGDVDIGQIQYWNPDNSMRFVTNTAEQMRIDSVGRVQIGYPGDYGSLYSMLLVRPDTASFGPTIFCGTYASTGSAVKFYSNVQAGAPNDAGTITLSGATTTYGTTSDYRLKENVADMAGAVERVKQLRPINFSWIADPERGTMDGFIAHEVAEVVPQAVSGEKDAMLPATEGVEAVEAVEATYDEDGNELTAALPAVEAVEAWPERPDPQSLDNSHLVPLLTAAVQELTARIAALEAAT